MGRRVKSKTNIALVNQKAGEYTAEAISKSPFYLDSLDEAAFKKTMDAIFKAIGTAYFTGYYAGYGAAEGSDA